MSESSKVTLSVEELINLTAHAATQEQLNDTRKELDQKIEAVLMTFQIKSKRFVMS